METMHTYIGTKVIKAFPMTRKEYNDERGWALPANENGDDPGYLVIYPDSDSNTEKYQGALNDARIREAALRRDLAAADSVPVKFVALVLIVVELPFDPLDDIHHAHHDS